MTKKVTPLFFLALTIALNLYWLKIDEKAIGLLTLFMVIGLIQFYSSITFAYEPLVRFLLVTISIGSIILSLMGFLGSRIIFTFFVIEPLIYAYFTKDPNLMVKWKPNKA